MARLRDNWPVIAAVGIGIGITLWTLNSWRGSNDKEIKSNIASSSARIRKKIKVYEKGGSERNQILDKNDEIRSLKFKAEAVGESNANLEILRKSVRNLEETMKFVQSIKAKQENAVGKEPVEDNPEDSSRWLEREAKIESDSETEPEDEEEFAAPLRQLGSIVSQVGSGIQTVSGIAQGLFFGSQRRMSTSR